jgi:3',5'-nucleoside bisphosphate phosphatase
MSERDVGGADLHVHTTHSDGGCSPGEVVRAAAMIGLRAVSITDHDTVSGVNVARPEAARLGIELVAGVELTAEWDAREIHILGHFIRDDDPRLLAACSMLLAARRDRIGLMIDRLSALGLRVDLAALQHAFPRAVLGRKHVADWLVRTGQVETRRLVFSRFLADGKPADVPKERLIADEAIQLILSAGGVAGLAHPPYDLRRRALTELVDAGLGAIEVDGPLMSSKLKQRWRESADYHGLVPIAGSDFHTADRPGRWVGSVTTCPADFERLRRSRATS